MGRSRLQAAGQFPECEVGLGCDDAPTARAARRRTSRDGTFAEPVPRLSTRSAARTRIASFLTRSEYTLVGAFCRTGATVIEKRTRLLLGSVRAMFAHSDTRNHVREG